MSTTTTDQLIAGAEVALEAAEKRRDKAIAEGRVVISVAQNEGRALSEDDTRTIDECNSRIEQSKADIASYQDQLSRLQSIKSEETAAERKYSEVTSTTEKPAAPKYDEVARVGAEERTYHAGNDPHGTQFLKDVLRSNVHRDPSAEHRLNQHMKEERVEREQYLTRAVGTSAFTGLTVPQYLTDLYAPATAALRPFANICNSHPLPADGMSVNISRITTASMVELQGSEGTAVAEQDMDDTLLTVNVQTNAGQQTVSRQAIDRGTGIEDVVFQDLFSRYHTNLDRTLLNQATNGLSDVATAVTYTSGTPAGDELYSKIVGATAGVEEAMLGLGTPSHAVMHSRRWYWLSGQMVDRWPLINSQGIPPVSGGTNANGQYGNGVRGMLPNGLSVIVDNNVSTTENTDQDEIYVVPSTECHLWEDSAAPLFIRAEQPKAANLQVLLVVYGYFAYTFGRYPAGMQKVIGTGLTPPGF